MMSRDHVGDMNRATEHWGLSRFYQDGSLRDIYVIGMDDEACEPDLDDGGSFPGFCPGSHLRRTGI
jgi:hypothetical protein